MGPKFYIITGLVVAAAIAFWAWTSWNRDNAKTIAEGAAVATTVATTDKAQGVKNEIRKRPVSDDLTIKRLRDGTW